MSLSASILLTLFVRNKCKNTMAIPTEDEKKKDAIIQA